MNNKERPATQAFDKTIIVHAPAANVWSALTEPPLMKKWMSETELDITTDWQAGGPISIKGTLNSILFESKGTVLQSEKEKVLEYSLLNSISRLPDVPESYTVTRFILTPVAAQTTLEFSVRNFPTESIYKHQAYYWNVALELLKKFVEAR